MKHKILECAERSDFIENMKRHQRREIVRYEQRISENREGVPITMKIIVKGKQGLLCRIYGELRDMWRVLLMTAVAMFVLLLAYAWVTNH